MNKPCKLDCSQTPPAADLLSSLGQLNQAWNWGHPSFTETFVLFSSQFSGFWVFLPNRYFLSNHSAFLLGYPKDGEFLGYYAAPYKRTKQLRNLLSPLPFRHTSPLLCPLCWGAQPQELLPCPWRCPLPSGHGAGGWAGQLLHWGTLALSHSSPGSISWEESRLFLPTHLILEIFWALLDSVRADL